MFCQEARLVWEHKISKDTHKLTNPATNKPTDTRSRKSQTPTGHVELGPINSAEDFTISCDQGSATVHVGVSDSATAASAGVVDIAGTAGTGTITPVTPTKNLFWKKRIKNNCTPFGRFNNFHTLPSSDFTTRFYPEAP